MLVDEMTKVVGLTPYGNCPVQAEGTVNGNPAYFRARGDGWSFAVSLPGVDPVNINAATDAGAVYYREGNWGAWPDAGWMAEIEAAAIITDCVAEMGGVPWPRRHAGRVELALRGLPNVVLGWFGRVPRWCRPVAWLLFKAWRFAAWLVGPAVRELALRRGAGSGEG